MGPGVVSSGTSVANAWVTSLDGAPRLKRGIILHQYLETKLSDRIEMLRISALIFGSEDLHKERIPK